MSVSDQPRADIHNTKLCDRCTKIPLEISKLYDIATGTSAYKVNGTGVVCEVRGFSETDCELCCLFRETAAKYSLRGEDYALKARVYRGSPLLDQPGLFLQLAEIEVKPRRGFIGLHQQGSTRKDGLRNPSTRTIKPNNVDWTCVKEWLQHCEAQHTCEPDPLRRFLLPGFRVIDTSTRRIIPAPVGCEYVALSYVWGVSSSREQLSTSWLPLPAPLTIEDAITSTRALGLTYLWVDRYCIDQSSHAIKDTMIQNMDKIYMNATLTLVDATGSSSYNGLAGVSRTRNPPKCFHIHGQQLSVISNIRSEVHQSKWNSRGWTFQEAILSRRRLVFAHSQLYFQCLEMHCCESLAWYLVPTHPLLTHDLSQLQVFPFHDTATGKSMVFQKRLSEYVRRDLTYEIDTINAFTGILRQLWRSPDPLYSFWGLPFQSGKFLGALLWLPIFWDHTPYSRRPTFPSWTWAGWKGLEQLDSLTCLSSPWPDHRFDVLVSIEEVSTGNQISPDDYITSMNELWIINGFKSFVNLTGWMTHGFITKDKDRILPFELGMVHVHIFHKMPKSKITVAVIMLRALADDFHLSVELLYEKRWPIFLFVMEDGGLLGMVLKHCDGVSYERIGVLNYVHFEPMVKLHDGKARLRKDDWDESTWLECERKAIKLV